MKQQLQQFTFSLRHKYCQFFRSSKNICNFLPAFENEPPVVGILFPVPHIMIHQLREILFSILRNFLFIYLCQRSKMNYQLWGSFFLFLKLRYPPIAGDSFFSSFFRSSNCDRFITFFSSRYYGCTARDLFFFSSNKLCSTNSRGFFFLSLIL